MVLKKKEGEIVPRTEAIRPFGLMGDLDRMFEDMDSWFWGPSFALTPRMTAGEGLRVPRINVKDEADRYVITAEMPGVKKENLELEMHENILEIRAREDSEKKDEGESYIYREMRKSSFHRQIRFGQDIVPENCDAELRDGILTVNLKKAEPAKPKKHSIAVK